MVQEGALAASVVRAVIGRPWFPLGPLVVVCLSWLVVVPGVPAALAGVVVVASAVPVGVCVVTDLLWLCSSGSDSGSSWLGSGGSSVACGDQLTVVMSGVLVLFRLLSLII